MSFARRFYSMLFRAALPFAVARLWWRGRREPGYRAHIGERFGHYGFDARGVLWIHAVSVGETRAAEPLVKALLAANPGERILLTHTTATGRATSETLFGDHVTRAYLPYDYPGAVSRFLDHFAPRLGVLLETEVWPNLVHACNARGVPVYLVNARLSQRSLNGYLRFAALAKPAFGAFTAVAAQTEGDAARLREAGSRVVEVTGNLKFDVTLPAGQLEEGARWHEAWAARPVLLAASTRDGEEALLLDAIDRLPRESLLVIVPRHPQRFDEVAALLERRGIAFARRSTGTAVSPDTRVLLGDSMGEMFAYYGACDVAFIGGSLLPFGAQNLIEACAAGKPILIGPHSYNFEDAARHAIEAGAALRVQNVQQLVATAGGLLASPARRSDMGRRGLDFARSHRGATARLLQILFPAS